MNTMVGYELIHKPQLFNHTQLGRNLVRAESMGFSTIRTQEEIENDKKNNSAFVKMSLTDAPPTVAKNLDPTGHWQS